MPMTKELAEELKRATDALVIAQEDHKQKSEAESQARGIAMQALNTLNNAQRLVDRLMEKAKEAPPWNSDWWGKNNNKGS